MAYDDLAFASTREQAERQAYCPECDETRAVGLRDTLCSCCGARLVVAVETGGATATGIFIGDGGGMADLVARMTAVAGAGASVGGRGVRDADLQSVLDRIMAMEQHRSGSPAASAGAIKKLRKHVVSGAAGGARAVLEEVTLLVRNSATMSPVPVVLVQAGFGPSMTSLGAGLETHALEGPLVAGEPQEGQGGALKNASACAGAVVVLKRGVVSFAAKARVAQEAGAIALLVAQTCDVWPYTMMDKAGESAGGGYEQAIPALMLRQEHGTRLLRSLRDRQQQGLPAPACEIRARPSGAECPICQMPMDDDGAVLVQMPCLHSFHEACLLQWLKRANNCPTCRFEVESEDAEWNNQRQQRQTAGAGGGVADDSADSWFG